MPDISMCSKTTCPSKKLCYRFTATPTPKRQTYAEFKLKEGETKCEYFWDNKT